MSLIYHSYLDPNIISWVKNYLSDRTQCIIVNGVVSDYLPVLSGVPQGSVLGPLLFLVYINDLMDLNLSEGSSLVLYADDILLYRPVASVADNIHDWTGCNFMTFNKKKCKLMHISHIRSPVLPTTPITLNGTVLETVNTFKYLGLLISSDLSWIPHIQNI